VIKTPIDLQDLRRRLYVKAKAEPSWRFWGLYVHVCKRETLAEAYRLTKANDGAPGIDGVTFEAIEADGLEGFFGQLRKELLQRTYRPLRLRKVGIPKAGGGTRQLSIPAIRDRVVQGALKLILEPIFEADFQPGSFGYRPKRSASGAIQRVAEATHVSHRHLTRFLEHRIADPCLLRVIHRFLKAGVMEDGAVTASEEGTPQGGLVSPVLANIYLHYVLDMWFEKRFARHCRGKAFLVRYCDDFIACFQHEGDARQFLAELRKRLADFELEVEPSKTGLIRFGSAAPWHCRKEARPKTFNFLGFTHYVHRSRRGCFVVGRRTERKRFQRKLQELNERLRALRARGGTAMLCYFRQHMQGHIRYYGVSGNYRQLAAYAYFASRLLYKWLNRRSQRRSTTWARFRTTLHNRWLPPLRIYHNLYPIPLWKTRAGSRMV